MGILLETEIIYIINNIIDKRVKNNRVILLIKYDENYII